MRAHRGTKLSWAWLLLATANFTCSAQARPLVLEEVAKLTLPDASYACCGRVAISDNIILLTASRVAAPPNSPSSIQQAAFVFERNAAGQWRYVTQLIEAIHEPSIHVTPISVALEGQYAAVALGRIYIFQRTPSGWVSIPSEVGAGNSSDIEANTGRLLVSDGGCSYNAHLLQRQATGYGEVQFFVGADHDGCDDEYLGGDVDISANRVVLGGPEVYVFTNTSGTMRLEAIGDSLRLYVNGKLTLEATDASHPKGIYGLAAFKTAVRYDDVNIREP